MKELKQYTLYNDVIMDHFMNPRYIGEAKNENAGSEVGAASCGDVLKLSLRINDNKIEEARVKIFGCGSAVSAADMMCELIEGKTVDEALKLTNEDVMDNLGGRDFWKSNFPQKIHCSVLSEEALKVAIENYKK